MQPVRKLIILYNMKKHTLKEWFIAVRPWSLPASVMPIVTTLAFLFFSESDVNWLHGLWALIGMILFHLTGNVWSDYFDFKKKVDSDDTFGAKTLTTGMFKPEEIKGLAIGLFVVSVICGLGLVAVTGLPLLYIGIAGAALTLLYPTLKFNALGDLDILLTFAFLPTLGTSYAVTVVEVLPNVVTQVKTIEKDGYVKAYKSYVSAKEIFLLRNEIRLASYLDNTLIKGVVKDHNDNLIANAKVTFSGLEPVYTNDDGYYEIVSTFERRSVNIIAAGYLDLDIEIDETFAKYSLQDEYSSEFELQAGQFVTDLNGEKEIDIYDLLYQSVILALPNKKVCGINCNEDMFMSDENYHEHDSRMDIFKNIQIERKD